MGIGTKTLPMSVYIDEQRSSNNGNACTLVRDCHAEVLARRGYYHHQQHHHHHNDYFKLLTDL